jgi:hypothetical protein
MEVEGVWCRDLSLDATRDLSLACVNFLERETEVSMAVKTEVSTPHPPAY